MTAVINTRPTAYVYDEEGHVLGGFQRGDLPEDEARVAQGIESGRLMKLDAPEHESELAPEAPHDNVPHAGSSGNPQEGN